jgi:hypothetical protein
MTAAAIVINMQDQNGRRLGEGDQGRPLSVQPGEWRVGSSSSEPRTR